MEQPQYNMFARDRVEKDYALLYEHYGTGLTIWSPLRFGILTGKYNDGIPADSRLAGEAQAKPKSFEADVEKVRKLKPIAEKLGCDQAALAMAWVLKNPRVSSAIMGASRPEQVAKTVRSLEVVPKLTGDIVAEIEAVLGNKPAELVRRP